MLKTYTVLYREEPNDTPFGFICQAEDTAHAQEQCLNAYPDCDVVWTTDGGSYVDALDEFFAD